MQQPPPLKDLTTLNLLATHYPTEKDVIHLLMDEGLLLKSADCQKCGKGMTLRSRGQSYEWRCRVSKGKDCSSKSIKHGSFFSNSKLNLTKAVKILILWNQKSCSKTMAAETQVSQQSVCDWRNFMRELCGRIEQRYPKIGGTDHIIEIDETNIHTRKYGRGKGIQEDWVFGGIDRTVGRVFAQRVPNRTAKTLVPILQRSVEKASVVYSDEWRSYSQLKKYFKMHFTVQHKTQFVNYVSNRQVCTNGVEAMWSRLKKPFKMSNGTSAALIASYISEFVCSENEKDAFFEKIIEEIRKVAG